MLIKSVLNRERLAYVAHVPHMRAFGGERGIRTPDTLAGVTDYQSGALSHSAIPGGQQLHCWPPRTGAYIYSI